MAFGNEKSDKSDIPERGACCEGNFYETDKTLSVPE